MNTETAHIRELDSRESDGLTVSIYWLVETDEIGLKVIDNRRSIAAQVIVAKAQARDAFWHPFCYVDSLSDDAEIVPQSLRV